MSSGLKITMYSALLAITSLLTACGGGDSGGSAPIIYYPFETVYGDACTSSSPTPGCTFNRGTGTRVSVVQDASYNRYGYGSDDLWYVKFYSGGVADVYNDLGVYQYTTTAASFAGYISGSTIGVGTTGLFWENVTNGTYWLGRNGVLYNANTGETNYGKAINTKDAQGASDTNFAALNSETNKKIVKIGAAKLVSEYGFNKEKAIAVASALNSWAVGASERGFTTEKDMDKTFKSVFGVEFSTSLTAVKDLMAGDKAGMQEVTNRSAAALGLKPAQAQKFIKGMYKKALASWGYDSDQISW